MKNKKIIKIFSIFALLTAFAACSNNNSETKEGSTASIESISSEQENKEANEESLENNAMSTESNDPKSANEIKSSQENESNTSKKDKEEEKLLDDGVYVTTLLASYKGEPIEESDSATTYEVVIEDDLLTVKGSLDYRKNFEDYENITRVEKDEHKFKIKDDTIFQAVGGTAPSDTMEEEEFISYLKELEESGLALIIEVEDGYVKTASISS